MEFLYCGLTVKLDLLIAFSYYASYDSCMQAAITMISKYCVCECLHEAVYTSMLQVKQYQVVSMIYWHCGIHSKHVAQTIICQLKAVRVAELCRSRCACIIGHDSARGQQGDVCRVTPDLHAATVT